MVAYERYEVVVVDDGSTDGSAEVLRGLMGDWPHLRVIRHLNNKGQSSALLTGIWEARGDLIITLDGDGQNDPRDLPLLVSEFEKRKRPFLLVTGRRSRRQDTWIKKISSRIANGVRSRILKDGTPDTGCGLKVFGRTDFLKLPGFDHMHRFLPALFIAMGGEVLSLDVRHRPRLKGSSHYGTLDRLLVGIVDLFGVWWLIRRMKYVEKEELIRDEG